MANAYYYSSTAGEYTLTTTVTPGATVLLLDGVTGLPGATPFKLVLDPGTASEEIVKVTAVAGFSLTVVRGWDGTSASGHSAGASIRHMLTSSDLTLSRAHEAASTSVHGVSGAVVGTTDIQTLSGKDLTDASNKFPASLATDAELAAHAALTATHGATGAVVGTTNTQTLTNKNLTSTTNTFPSTLATDAELSAHTGDTSAHGATGGVVGATKAQTLTNKNLSSSSNTFPVPLNDTGNVTTTNQISAASGWAINTFSGVRRNGMAQVYIRITRTGSSISVPASTNLNNIQVGTIASAWNPLVPAPGSTVANGPLLAGYIWTDRTVSLSATGGSINNGDSISLAFTYALANY